MKHARRHLTYANVMSSIAVFLVIGGGAAFAALGRNTVGTKQLKRNAVRVGKIGPEAVKAGKLAKNAVSTNRLRDGAVANSKIGTAAVTNSKIADNSVSPRTVAPGAIGASQLAGLNVRTNSVVIPNEGTNSVSVSCQPNEQVIGAGTDWTPDGQERFTNYVRITSSNGAVARGNQFTGSDKTFTVLAYCLVG